MFAQSLAQRKTGFPGDFGALLAFHLEAYLTDVQNRHTGTSILVNNSSGQLAQTGHIDSIQLSLPVEHGGHI